MTEFKGTTGKWKACIDFANEDRIIIYADSGIQPHICYTPDFAYDDEVMEANAQLIAELPELLGALQRLIEAAKPHCVPTSLLNKRVKEAELIINNALGLEAQNV